MCSWTLHKPHKPCCMQAYPLDLVRTRLAAQTTSRYYHGIAGTLATIVRDEGLAGLYRGMGPTLLQTVRPDSTGCSLCSQQITCKVASAQEAHCLQHNDPCSTMTPMPGTHPAQVTCSLPITCCAQVPSLALNYCAYETLRSRWLCLTNSDTPTVRRLAVSTTDQSCTANVFHWLGLPSPARLHCCCCLPTCCLHDMTQPPSAAHPVQVATSLVCGSLAGLVSSTATFPLDLVRRRLQLEGRAGGQYRWATTAWLCLLSVIVLNTATVRA